MGDPSGLTAFLELELQDGKGRFVVAKPEIARLALRLWDVFWSRVPAYANVQRANLRKNAKYFYRAALACSESQLNAEQYVEQQLRGMAVKGSFWPKLIATDFGNGTEQTHDRLSAQTAAYYKSQLQAYTAACTVQSPREILEHASVTFSPLFRWQLAKQNGFEDLALQLRDAANAEYLGRVGADKVFDRP